MREKGERDILCGCVCERERGREILCVCVCVCEREGESERSIVCVCVRVWKKTEKLTDILFFLWHFDPIVTPGLALPDFAIIAHDTLSRTPLDE